MNLNNFSQNIKKNKVQFIANTLFVLFIFESLFITFRVLLIRGAESQTISEYMLSALPEFFIIFLIILVLYTSSRKFSFRNITTLDKIVLLYVLTNVVLGTFLAHDIKLSLYAVRLSYLPIIFYFIARISFNTAQNEFEKYFKKIIDWYLVVALIGLILYFGFPELITNFLSLSADGVEAEYHIKRMGSLFWSPVIFGTFMTISALYYFYRLLKKEKIVYYLVYAIFWCCLFLSVSRGSLISFYIGWIMLAIIFKQWKIFLKSLFVMALVVFLLFLNDHKIYDVLIFIADSSLDTFGMKRGLTRVELWTAAYNDFVKNPMGYGLGKAGHIAARFFGKYSHNAATFSTDGWYLKLANETGVWGLASFFTLAITYFIQSVNIFRRSMTNMNIFIFVMFIIVMVQNIVSNVLDFYSFSCLFWLLVGVSQNIYVSLKNEKL